MSQAKAEFKCFYDDNDKLILKHDSEQAATNFGVQFDITGAGIGPGYYVVLPWNQIDEVISTLRKMQDEAGQISRFDEDTRGEDQ